MKDRDKMAASAHIDVPELLSLYDEAKNILTEAAEYFSGPGIPKNLSLNGEAAMAYTEASKCLTARLMEIMAWLFIQRAVLLGEISLEDALEDDTRFESVLIPRFDPRDRKYHLPARFCDIDRRSSDLFGRIRRINQLLALPPADARH